VLRHSPRRGFSHWVPFAWVATSVISAACALNDPLEVREITRLRTDAGAPAAPPPRTVDAGSARDAGATVPPPVIPPPDVIPPGACTPGQTKPCGPATEAGNCALGTRFCVNGSWGNCIDAVYPSPRICGATDDKDCDGVLDDVTDALCVCNPGNVESCDTHPGLDSVGACKAGKRTCEASADGLTSHWGACSGSVGPAAADSCLIRGDDSNCDATPNSGCACIEGEVVACGPSDQGICKKGTSTCVDLEFTECVDAILPRTRDCSSEDDNDCDGAADNTIDETCACEVASSEPCGTHPEDGVGVCKAGTRTCVAGEDGASSNFGACTGSVGPGARRCNSAADNDCNGVADSTIDTVCKCEIGAVQLCEQHPGLDDIGRCRAGQQLCVAGANNATAAFSTCAGSVGPAAADSCAVAGDDSNCDGTPNGGCACVAGNNEPCTAPAAAKCSAAGTCVACTANADCSLLGDLKVCSAGSCVECTADANCPTGEICNTTSQICAVPTPVPVPVPVPVPLPLPLPAPVPAAG
jgi:Cys-rich repeat protein